ncbi:hypothetical protein I308_106585 [Cryptococcus tetragattii IND107]|uniref:Glycoside hydrolase family 5 domain-containing protein n=1 Tax=Cryptococcus tetragattii IND107 TaxID=1296105 RepID=A0ABR3BI00_9TREE
MVKLSPCAFLISQFLISTITLPVRTLVLGNHDSIFNKRTTLAPGFTWGTDPMRGVNIGGWLVLEPWITPSIFEGKPDWVIDEWTYGVYMNNRTDTIELENIAAVGLNTIRIQIAFWSVIPLENGEPYLVGAYDYLKLAVTWASSLNLKVMVDVHGCPGGQNGFDNSGIRGVREWSTNDTNIPRTLSTIQALTAEFSQWFYNDTVIAIELINEPFPYSTAELDILKSYYEAGYGTHIYTMFDTGLITMGYSESLDWYCGQKDYLVTSNNVHWTIVGEFAPANTDCAYWLNGRGMGARYDNTLNTSASLRYPGDCGGKTGADPRKFSAEYVEYLAKSFETQTWVYEQASGWVMWTWKTEQAADWSMQTGITYGER